VSLAEPLLDTAFITVSSPFARPLSFLLLELVVLSSGVLGLRHALRAPSRGPLFTWVTIFVYGLVMEVLSYNFTTAFAHGQFTVMFYRHQLPLYVTAIYPVLLYTAIATARRLRVHRAAEPFVAGLLIVAMDVPFDILGPVAGWWSWSDADPNMAYRWLGVPVTSYYWHFAFGGILCALTRAVQPYVEAPAREARFLLAIPVSLLTIVLGVLSFLPFHLLKAIGVSEGVIVGGLLGLGGAVLVVAKKERPQDRDELLLAIAALFYGAHLSFAVVRLVLGLRSGPGLEGFLSRFVAIAAVTVLAAVAHERAQAVKPAPTLSP
jgi:hypothetical protein